MVSYSEHRRAPVNLNRPEDDFRQEVDTSKIVVDEPGNFRNLPDNCDKFRILIIGKAGVGKSTICSTVFGVPPEATGVSHRTVGTQRERVWYPITFPGANENLILHDSGGFEAGDLKCVEEISSFIKDRRQQPKLADQLHCIWYCISCRSNRPIESAEKEFFFNADVGDIPVVVVFTQFDQLVNEHLGPELSRQMARGGQLDLVQMKKDATNAAIADYDTNYRGQFERVFGRRLRVQMVRLEIPPSDPESMIQAPGLDTLVKYTREMLLEDGLRQLWTAAQCHSADMKLRESIQKGMSVFWKAVGASAIPFIPFVGATAVYKAFVKLLEKITNAWGIRGCRALIKDSKVRNMFLQGCFNVSTMEILGAKFMMSLNFFGPLTAVQTSLTILKMIAGISLIYEMLFWDVKEHPEREVSEATIDRIVCGFRLSRGHKKMSALLAHGIHVGNCYSKTECMEQLENAIEDSRLRRGKEGMRKKTVAG